MKVGLNLTYLVEDSGGTSTYARGLIPALMAQGVDVTAWIGSTAPADVWEEPWAGDVDWVELPVPGVNSPWHLAYELSLIGLAAARRKLDVMHGLAFLTPVTSPGLATVSTVHDVNWMHYPESLEPRARFMFRLLVPFVARRVDRIVAISEAARDDIAHMLRLDPAKFDIAHHGMSAPRPAPADLDGLRARLGLDERPIVLCVAARRVHKNVHSLIRALVLLDEPRPQLVLPGIPNAYDRQLRGLTGELGLENDVRFCDWVSDEDLEGLYALAACFALPTLTEGFGLPVLEAMARGVPVACSGIPALTEVAGDAALFFDPNRPREIADAVRRLLRDEQLRDRLVASGRERAVQFTWERSARETIACYERALGAG